MRIFLSCLQSPHDYPIPAYRFWSTYFNEGLNEAGHTVINSQADWARGLLPLEHDELGQWREETWTSTVESVRSAHANGRVDLFLSYLYPRQILPCAIRAIQELGIPCVNFFCDHVREYRSLPDEFAAFDLHWVPEFKALPMYRARGWKHVHAPMPCWIEPAQRHLPSHEQRITSFIGGRDPLRAELLAEGIRAGLSIEIRGAGWLGSTSPVKMARPSFSRNMGHWGEFWGRQGLRATTRRLFSRFALPGLDFDFSQYVRPVPSMNEYQKIIAQSAVSIGINRYPSFHHAASRPDTYSRLRDIEAPMLGACYLTEWTEGLDQLYDLDHEIATYRNTEELIEQTRALLADSTRRQNLRRAGQLRALSDHTIGRSLSRIASALGLPSR